MKYDKLKFKQDLREEKWINVLKQPDINNAWFAFKSILTSLVDRHAPKVERQVRGRDCPWLTNDIRTKMKERDHMLKKE